MAVFESKKDFNLSTQIVKSKTSNTYDTCSGGQSARLW